MRAASLKTLAARVDQVRGYQEISLTVTTDEELAHFTKWEASCKMLEYPDPGVPDPPGVILWAGDADCLNDPLEGQALLLFAQTTGQLEIGKEAPDYVTGRYNRDLSQAGRQGEYDHTDLPHLAFKKWERLFSNLKDLYGDKLSYIVSGSPAPELIVGSNTYLVSFCSDVDRLDLWRAYGENATGICLVMPLAAAVQEVKEANWGFYRVAYDDRSKARAWAVLQEPIDHAVKLARRLPPGRREDRLAEIKAILNPVHFLFKHDQFRTEREIRLMHRHPAAALVKVKPGDSGTFVPTDAFFLASEGSRVILGPKCPDKKIRAAVLRTHLFKRFGENAPSVERSGVPYQ